MLALIVTEGLLIEVPKQMEGFDTDIGAFDGPLQETPKVLQAVRVNRTVNVSFRMVDYFVSVFIEPIVRPQCIGVEFRSCFHILSNFRVNVVLPSRVNDGCPHIASLAFQQTKHDGLSIRPVSVNLFLTLFLVQ